MRRIALLAVTTLALLAGAWWLVRPETPAVDGATAAGPVPELADRAGRAAAADPAGCGPEAPADVLGWQAPRPERLVAGAGLPARDRVAELVTDLRMLRPSSRFAGSELGVVRRLDQFVLDVVAADQVEAVVLEVERLLDEPTPAAAAPDGQRAGAAPGGRARGVPQRTAPERAVASDDWLSARLLVALAGLGASEPVIERWPQLVAVERADVLVALGWDPLAGPDVTPLQTRRADDLVRGVPLLPLALTRPPTGEVLDFLRRRLAEPTGGLHGLRVRDASVLVLGLGIGHDPACLELIEGSLRADPLGSFVALFTLTASEHPDAAALLARLRRRHADGHPVDADDLAGHERFALDMGHTLVAAHGEALLDLAALRAGLSPGRPADARLDGAACVLARISDGVPQIPTRKSLSDMLVGALVNERDRDVAWLELLALRQLHIGEAWLPSRTIGYGAEDGLDHGRAGERTATFLAYLGDPHPATRRLAVLGLLGSSSGDDVQPALTDALAVEQDGRIKQWMRLALLRL